MRQKICRLVLLVGTLATLAWAQSGQADLKATSTSLQLDAGQRWVVDVPMMVHLRAMENDLSSFRGSSLQDYRGLGGRLEEQLHLLVSGCTMEGAAHDQLHKWLVPYMGEVHAFVKADDLKILKTRRQALAKSFELFNAYFR